MADRLRITAIEFVGPSRDFTALRRQLAELAGDADDVEVGRLRVILTDRAVSPDQVDEVIHALNEGSETA